MKTGTVLAALIVPLDLGGEGWAIAAALASRHIGGYPPFPCYTQRYLLLLFIHTPHTTHSNPP